MIKQYLNLIIIINKNDSSVYLNSTTEDITTLLDTPSVIHISRNVKLYT